MVRVDMSLARAQIAKRKRRRRRAIARRIARAREIEAKELAAVQAAHQARLKAIETWTAEEERLEKLRHKQKNKNDDTRKQNQNCLQNKRTVRFAGEVLVTEIPNRCSASLPKPVVSPIGVAITEPAIAKERQTELSQEGKAILEAVKANGGEILRMDEDWDDDDDLENDPNAEPEHFENEDPHITTVSRRRRARRGYSASFSRRVGAQAAASSAGPAAFKSQETTLHIVSESSEEKPGEHYQLNTKSDQQRMLTTSDRTAHEQCSQSNGNALHKLQKVQASKAPSGHERERQDSDTTSDSKKEIRKGLKRRKSEMNGSINDNINSSACVSAFATGEGVETALVNGTLSKIEHAQSESPSNSRKKKKRKLSHPSAPSSIAKPGSEENIPLGTNAGRPSENESPSSKATNGNSGKLKSGRKQTFGEDDHDETELDSIFNTLAKKRAAQSSEKPNNDTLKQKGSAVKAERRPEKKQHRSKNAQRYTEDGLRIVSYEEIARDQPTNLNGPCPFDCSCCFM